MKPLKFEYKITLAYLILAILWMSCCDFALKTIIADADLLAQVQNYKDIVLVILTAISLFFILKNHLIKLRCAESKSLESDNLKSAFLQNISREILYPMNGIVTASRQLSANCQITPQNLEFLDTIAKSTGQLSNIVNEIVDISLIQSGEIVVSPIRVNLNKMVDDIHQTLKPQIKKTIYFSFIKGLPDSECTILTDGPKVKQLIYRLLSNAMKFTEKGEIQFGYAVKHSNLVFFVKDTGVGIKQAMEEKIFVAFHKIDNDNFEINRGIGLGLTICKSYIDLLKGKIWVDTEENIGSTFYFTLPYNPVSREERKKVQKIVNTNDVDADSKSFLEE